MGKFIFKIKIQSVSDIITNSSSETFVITDVSAPKEVLLEELKSVNKSFPRWYEVFKDYREYQDLPPKEKAKYENCSGDGGTIEVWDWKTEMENWIDCCIAKSKRHLVTPEIWALSEDRSLEELQKCLWVRIDEGFKNTLNYLLQNYDIYEENCGNYFLAEKDPNTGKLLRTVTYEEFGQLPKERKAFEEWFNNED